MRLPNNFGSVYKLSGKRRKPWVARITKDWQINEITKKAQPIYEFIGYYETRKEALSALTEYNKNPYDLTNKTITFEEVYLKWSDKKFEEISKSNILGYKSAFKICSKIKDLKFVDIKLEHLQRIVDESGKNYPTLRKLKVLLGHLFDYAVMHEIITKDRNIVEYMISKNQETQMLIIENLFQKMKLKKFGII